MQVQPSHNITDAEHNNAPSTNHEHINRNPDTAYMPDAMNDHESSASFSPTTHIIHDNPHDNTHASIPSFFITMDDIVDIASQHNITLATELRHNVILGAINHDEHAIYINLTKNASKNLLPQAQKFIKDYTQGEWRIILDSDVEGATLKDQQLKQRQDIKKKLYAKDDVQKILSFFPNASIISHKSFL